MGGWHDTLPVDDAGLRMENVWVNGATTVVMVVDPVWVNRIGVAAAMTMDVTVDPVPTVTISEVVPEPIWMNVPATAAVADVMVMGPAPGTSGPGGRPRQSP